MKIFENSPLWYKALMIFLTVVLIALVSIAAFRPPALSQMLIEKSPLGSKTWDRDIYYFNDSGYNQTIKMAISRWDKTGIPVTFVETINKEKADIIISDNEEALSENCDKGKECIGHAPVGRSPLGLNDRYLYIKKTNNPREDLVVDTTRMQTMIHEMGHVLGLWHDNESECSVMSSSASECYRSLDTKTTKRGTVFNCGPSKSDVEKIRDLYRVNSTAPVSSHCLDSAANTDWQKDVFEQIADGVAKEQDRREAQRLNYR